MSPARRRSWRSPRTPSWKGRVFQSASRWSGPLQMTTSPEAPSGKSWDAAFTAWPWSFPAALGALAHQRSTSRKRCPPRRSKAPTGRTQLRPLRPSKPLPKRLLRLLPHRGNAPAANPHLEMKALRRRPREKTALTSSSLPERMVLPSPTLPGLLILLPGPRSRSEARAAWPRRGNRVL